MSQCVSGSYDAHGNIARKKSILRVTHDAAGSRAIHTFVGVLQTSHSHHNLVMHTSY